MDKVTAVNHPIRKAPKRIELLGDKTKRPEPAQHIIEFPGGAIELSRLEDGSYWAYIIVERRPRYATGSVVGEIVDSRIDYRRHGGDVISIPGAADVEQIAVLIRPRSS